MPIRHGRRRLTPTICLASSGSPEGSRPTLRITRHTYCQPATRRTADVRAKGKSAMDRRRLLLILSVFVAIIGTALVFLYVQGADKRAADKVANVQVLPATQGVAAGEKYDDALSAGKIPLQEVPKP